MSEEIAILQCITIINFNNQHLQDLITRTGPLPVTESFLRVVYE